MMRGDLSKFLVSQGFSSDLRIDIVSHREGCFVGHFHHEGSDYTIKHFAESDELKDQFEREYHFYRLLKFLQIKTAPSLLGSSHQGILLSRIAGRGIRENEIDHSAIKKALDFIISINHNGGFSFSQTSPKATHSCLSIREHLSEVASQIAKVQKWQKDVNPQTESLIQNEMSPLWERVLGNILSQFQTAGMDIDRELSREEAVISPGEFGFHNALFTKDREIYFIDFDRSGWDDPARFLGNFFTLGPFVPKEIHWDFAIEMLSKLPHLDAHFAIRARLLLPAYQMARASSSLLQCLQKGGKRHSKIKMIDATNQSRSWLKKASMTFGESSESSESY